MSNPFTKLLWTLILSTMTLFLMWFMIGWVEYGDEIFNMHLDVRQTFAQLNGIQFSINFNGKEYNLMSLFRWVRDLINNTANGGLVARFVGNLNGGGELSSGLGVFLTAITTPLDPIYSILQSVIILTVVGVVIIVILLLFFNFTLSLGEFLISPVWLVA